jgi:hypothetical protein
VLSGVMVAVAAIAASLLTSVDVPSAGAAPLRTIWREQSVCGPATTGRASCLAVRLVAHQVSATAKLASTDITTRPTSALPSALTGRSGGYTPTALAAAYGYNPAAAVGARQVIAIVDACYDTSITSDLNTFDNNYGLPAETDSTFRVVHQTTGGDQCVLDDRRGWSLETALDVQAVRGVCQKCKILLVEGVSPSLDDLASAVDLAARYRWISGGVRLPITAISNSYGAAENNPGLPDGYARHYQHAGVAVVAANGDDGWYGWDTINDFNGDPEGASEVPASLPTVVGVGGTKLGLTRTGRRASETVWNENGNSDSVGAQQGSQGASGGGCSRLHAARGWQRGVATFPYLRCAGKRNSTDIAAIADPTTGYDVYGPNQLGLDQWQTVGGTSLAAPVIAAMWGLAGGTGRVKNPGLSLYGNYKSRPRSVFDVIHGGNGFCGNATLADCAAAWRGNPNAYAGMLVDCGFARRGTTRYPTASGCRARTGYDGPSGVGTPAGLQVFRPLAPKAGIAGPTTVTRGVRVTFGGGASTDPFPAGHIASWTWLWSNGHPTTVTTATTKHTFFRTGRFTVRLKVTDNYGRSSVLASFPVTVR